MNVILFILTAVVILCVLPVSSSIVIHRYFKKCRFLKYIPALISIAIFLVISFFVPVKHSEGNPYILEESLPKLLYLASTIIFFLFTLITSLIIDILAFIKMLIRKATL